MSIDQILIYYCNGKFAISFQDGHMLFLFNGYYMLLFVPGIENGDYSSVYIITPKRILLMLATRIMLILFLFCNNCHLNVTKCYGILYAY